MQTGAGKLEQQLELLRTGKVHTGEDTGTGWVDTTAQSIQRAKARLAELQDLLTEAGTANVAVPENADAEPLNTTSEFPE